MRIGRVEEQGKSYCIHVHVIARGSDEHQELVWFREKLRSNVELTSQYEARKRAILTSGVTDPIDYCHAKSAFITDLLQAR
jgi:GrpB-like predicted nucleotidyltransferase (UPF0157 family)